MSDIIDITVQETIDVVDITVNPNIIEVNVTRTSGGGGTQTLAQTLDLGNTTGGENISISNGDAIILDNGSMLKKGTIDAGNGGAKGISQICGVGFEHKWEAGRLYIMNDGGTIIREVSHNLTYTPTATDDVTKGFVQNTRWILDNGDIYVCTDPTEDAAVWEFVTGAVPTLQQVVNENNLLTDSSITFDSVGNPNLTSGISIDGLSFVDNDGIDEETTVYASNGIQRNLNANGTLLNFETPTNPDNVVLVPNGSGTLALTSDIPTTTSQLTNDGADGVNPFITALDIPTTGQASTLVREVKNMTGATLTKGTVVYISGSNGNKALVSKAIATTDALSARTFGLLQSNISNNGLGNCVVIGDLSGIDTSSFAEGAQLYLSGVTAGTFTDTRVLAPTHLVYVGKVTRSHPTQGQIEVQIQNGYELAEIHDVSITSVTNNQLLAYTSATDLWENKSINDIIVDSNRTRGIAFFDDFLGTNDNAGIATSTGVTMSAVGTGSAARITGTYPNRTNQQGVIQLATGTTASGGASFRLGSVNTPTFFVGSGAISHEVLINIETLSTLANRFVNVFGFHTGSSITTSNNLISFIYDEGGVFASGGLGASPNWKCVTGNGGTRTSTDSTIAVTASAWTKLRIEINANATSVGFYINDTLVATHTTNIPATTTAMYFLNGIQKTTGLTSVNIYGDYFSLKQNFTTAR